MSEISNPYRGAIVVKYYKTRDVFYILLCSISYRHLQQARRALSLQKIVVGNAEIYARMHRSLHSCVSDIPTSF